MHMHLLQHLGSQLMPQNVESVYEMFTSEFHWPKEHVNWHIHSCATNPVCVVCVLCARVMCMCGGLTLGFNEAAAIHCGHTYLTPMTGFSTYQPTCWSPSCEQQGNISPHIKGIHGGTGAQMPEEGIDRLTDVTIPRSKGLNV